MAIIMDIPITPALITGFTLFIKSSLQNDKG